MTPTGEARSFPYSADENAKVLVLGSMPGAESLRQQQYYAFKHNAFWRIMGEVYGFSPELPYLERLAATAPRQMPLAPKLPLMEVTPSSVE